MNHPRSMLLGNSDVVWKPSDLSSRFVKVVNSGSVHESFFIGR